jgi:hypothetical protein
MNILDLIESNSNPKEQQKRIDLFEQTNGFQLPPIFKSFYKNFDCSNILNDKLLCYFNEEYSTSLQCYDSEYKTDMRIAFHNFWDLESITDKMNSIYNQENDSQIKIENYLAIGESSNQGILLVGRTEINKDEIFIEYAHEEKRITKIEDDIFAFLRNYEIQISNSDLPNEVSVNNLIRKWGEKYWRIVNS